MKYTDIKNVAVIGAGTIGASWASFFAMRGLKVHLYDIKQEQLDRGREIIRSNYALLESKDLLSKDEVNTALKQITVTTDLKTAVIGADFIQENGPETYDIKKSMLAEIEKYTADDTIIASSTSGLLITEIAKDAVHPERCVGAHPYNPPYLMPLVEITKGDKTDEEIVKTTKEFYQSLGKEPVVLNKETMGFIANRIQAAMLRESYDLVMRGVCSVEDVDKAITFGLGLRFAFLGIHMITVLNGGKEGTRGINRLTGESVSMWLEDMPTWTKYPPNGWEEPILSGVEEELKNRSPETGNDQDSLRRYRDDMLVEVLKLHNKL